jgi:ABC-2 type transport system ATP-binding protein
LFEHLTVKETLELYASFYPKARPIPELLDAFDLKEKATTLVKHLSGGQKQRLAIALAVVHDPKVIFLDEPTTGLDPQARRNLWEIILQLRNEGRTVVLSTHYMEEAEFLCDRVAIMDRGNLIALDTPEALIRQLASESRIEFFLSNLQLVSELHHLTGVKKVSQEGEELVVLHTDALSETLSDLIHLANEKQIPVNGLRTRTATLEDVFLEKTGKRLSEE